MVVLNKHISNFSNHFNFYHHEDCKASYCDAHAYPFPKNKHWPEVCWTGQLLGGLVPGCVFEQTTLTLSHCTLVCWGAESEPVASSGPFGFSPAMNWACQELCWHILSHCLCFVSYKQEQLRPWVSCTCAHGQPLFLDVYWQPSRGLCGLKYLDIL